MINCGEYSNGTIQKWLYFFVFSLLYFSVDSFLFGVNANNTFTSIGTIFYYIAAGILLIYILLHRINMPKKIFLIGGALFLSSTITIFLNGEQIGAYMLLWSAILLAVLFTTVVPYDDFKRIFADIMFFLAITSLIVYAIRLLVPSILSIFPTVKNYMGYEFRNYFLGQFHIPDNLRNQSIFRESGVNALFLILALYYELFTFENIRIKRIIIIALGIISTYSTTGFLVCGLLVIIFILLKKDITINMKVGMVVIIVIMCAAIAYFGQDIIQSTHVFSKLSKGDSYYGSTDSRWGGILCNIYMFITSPIFGVGEYYMSNNFSSILLTKYSIYTGDNTNTFLSLYSCYGFFVGTVSAFGWLQANRTNNRLLTWGSFLAFFLLLSGENMWHNAIFWIVVFYGLLTGREIQDEYITG